MPALYCSMGANMGTTDSAQCVAGQINSISIYFKEPRHFERWVYQVTVQAWSRNDFKSGHHSIFYGIAITAFNRESETAPEHSAFSTQCHRFQLKHAPVGLLQECLKSENNMHIILDIMNVFWCGHEGNIICYYEVRFGFPGSIREEEVDVWRWMISAEDGGKKN